MKQEQGGKGRGTGLEQEAGLSDKERARIRSLREGWTRAVVARQGQK